MGYMDEARQRMREQREHLRNRWEERGESGRGEDRYYGRPVERWENEDEPGYGASLDEGRYEERPYYEREQRRTGQAYYPAESSYDRSGYVYGGEGREYGRERAPRFGAQREYPNRYGQQGRAGREYYGGGYGQEYGGYGQGGYGPYGGGYGQRPYQGEEEEGGVGRQLREFGGAMAGRMRRAFRAPKGYRRSDERIREDVCDRMGQSGDLDPSDVEVSVSNGEVSLRGTVPERFMKWEAEQLADGVPGVVDIHNQIRVQREGEQTQTSAQSTTAGSAAQARGAQSRGS